MVFLSLIHFTIKKWNPILNKDNSTAEIKNDQEIHHQLNSIKLLICLMLNDEKIQAIVKKGKRSESRFGY